MNIIHICMNLSMDTECLSVFLLLPCQSLLNLYIFYFVYCTILYFRNHCDLEIKFI